MNVRIVRTLLIAVPGLAAPMGVADAQTAPPVVIQPPPPPTVVISPPAAGQLSRAFRRGSNM